MERNRDATDRRRNLTALTPAGEAALAALSARMDAAQDVLLAPPTPPSGSSARLLTRPTEQVR